MNARRSTQNQKYAKPPATSERRAFTLLEVLVVITIIGILIGALGGVINNSIRKARESATVALLLKIEGLLDERMKGFERATKSRDFQRIVETQRRALEAASIFGVSPKVIEAVARKDFFRQNFPQRLEDLPDTNNNYIPDVFEPPPLGDPQITLNLANFRNSDPLNRLVREQNENAESSELLYYSLTRMQAFGVPPVGESEFSTSEYRDTDGDGLLEFIDGWGRPLRFYRWPTRLLKPSGMYGSDGQPGVATVDDDNNGTVDDFLEFGTLGSDDVALARVPPIYSSPPGLPLDIRPIAGLMAEGLSPRPALPLQQWDSLSEDPDDPYGLITTELKRLFLSYGPVVLASYSEPLYPTLDTYHTSLIVSTGADGELGLFEPFLAWDSLLPGVPYAGDGAIDYGVLAQPVYSTANNPYAISNTTFSALTDNLTNRNRRAGKGK